MSTDLAALIIISMLSPLAARAQDATPVVSETPPTEMVTPTPPETPTSEPEKQAAPTVERGRVVPMADAAPTVTVNGQTGTVAVAAGSVVTIDFPTDAEAAIFQAASCSGLQGSWRTLPYQYVFGVGTYSVQVRSSSDRANVGNCVTINSLQVPLVTVNGSLDPQNVLVRTVVKAESPGDAELAIFDTASCSGVPILGWISNSHSVTASDPMTLWFSVRLKAYPTIVGNCLQVNWLANTTITVNGSAGPLYVTPGTAVTPTFSASSEWTTFAGATCAGQPLGSWSTSPSPVSGDTAGSRSFQARLTAIPTILSNCLTVTWREATPTITVNGSTNPVIVPVNTNVQPLFPEGATYARFPSRDCSGNPDVPWSALGSIFVWESPREASFQARWGSDYSTRGNCLSISVEPVSVPTLASAVCGNDNDTLTLPSAQAGITFSDSGWANNQRTITLTAVDGYHFMPNQQTTFVFTDTGPCSTGAPEPPIQAAVCGPDNDSVTISDVLPDGITLENDSDWSDNTRTITFAVDPAYVTTGQLVYTLTYANEECPPTVRTVIVSFNASDGGSLSGAPYELYAPVAAQVPVIDSYREGVVGTNNQIDLQNLPLGQYRLLVSAGGYEPIDETFIVVEGEGAQTISFDAVLAQVTTPTPEPTVEPTVEPTAEPTIESTVEPTIAPTLPATPVVSETPTNVAPAETATVAPVSGLPSTGTGSAGSTIGILLGLLTVAVVGAGSIRRFAR